MRTQISTAIITALLLAGCDTSTPPLPTGTTYGDGCDASIATTETGTGTGTETGAEQPPVWCCDCSECWAWQGTDVECAAAHPGGDVCDLETADECLASCGSSTETDTGQEATAVCCSCEPLDCQPWAYGEDACEVDQSNAQGQPLVWCELSVFAPPVLGWPLDCEAECNAM